MQLDDKYHANGHDLASLRKEMKLMDASTETAVIDCENLEILSYFASGSTKETAKFFWLSGRTFEKRRLTGENSFASIQTSRLNQDLFRETVDGGAGFFGKYGQTLLYFSKNAVMTLCLRCKLGGQFATIASTERDEAIAKALSISKEKATLIIRNDKKKLKNGKTVTTRKVFAAPSGSFVYEKSELITSITQKILKKFSHMGAELIYWDNTHTTTKVFIEFPSLAKQWKKQYALPDIFTPGLLLESSSVAASAWKITGTFRLGNAKIPVMRNDLNGSFTKEHRGHAATVEDFIEAADRIMASAEPYASALAFQNTASVNIAYSQSRLTRIIKDCVKEMQLTGVIGKARSKKMEDEIVASFNTEQKVTAYMLIQRFLQFEKYLQDPMPYVITKAQNKMLDAIGLAIAEKEAPVLEVED